MHMTIEEQRATFKTDGFVILPGFFSKAECDELLSQLRAAQAMAEASGLDKYGLSFKHNLYRISAPLRSFVSQQKIVDFLREIIGPDFWVRWDQTVEKTPGGAEFPWHQDNGYNGLVDGHFQFWVSLSNMTPDNGGLWLQKGSHRNGPLPHHRVGNHMVCPGNEKDAVFIPATIGDAVLFSSFLLHRTSPNVTDTSRLAYVIEYMSCEHFDPFIPAPYFVVARNGQPAGKWVNFYRGRLNPVNQLKYLPTRMSRRVTSMAGRINRLFKGSEANQTANN